MKKVNPFVLGAVAVGVVLLLNRNKKKTATAAASSGDRVPAPTWSPTGRI